MILVLLPSRAQVKLLERAVKSIWDMSSSKDAVEIVVRADEDDQETIDYLNHINYLSNVHVLIGPHLYGYKSLPSFFNEMAVASKGEVLMCCNDDAIFKSKNWDSIIKDIATYYSDGIFNIL